MTKPIKKPAKIPKVLQRLPGTRKVGSFKEAITDVQKTMGELHLSASRRHR